MTSRACGPAGCFSPACCLVRWRLIEKKPAQEECEWRLYQFLRGHLCPLGQGHPTVSPGLDFNVPEILMDPGRMRSVDLESHVGSFACPGGTLQLWMGEGISQKEDGGAGGPQMPSSGCGEPQNRKKQGEGGGSPGQERGL